MTLGELLIKLKRIHMMHREAPLVVEYVTPLGKRRRVSLSDDMRVERDDDGNPIVIVDGHIEATE